jgi:sucrose-6-phosphate hydrolase SacC (GH32 family)
MGRAGSGVNGGAASAAAAAAAVASHLPPRTTSITTAFHVRPRSGWINDPNGPLLFRGTYHL